MMKKIFISYKRVDLDQVIPIKARIEKETGVECWIDINGIESDAYFDDVICKAINDSEIFLFFYSKSHLIEKDSEDWPANEIRFANKKGKRIVIIHLDDTELSDKLDIRYGSKQKVFAEKEKSIERLVSDIRSWLAIEDNEEATVSEKISESKLNYRDDLQKKSFKFKKGTGKVLSNIWNSAHADGEKHENDYRNVVSNVMDWFVVKDEKLPKSLAITSGERKICFVLSEDEKYYMANLNQKSDNFAWWHNQTIVLVGASALIAGAPILAAVGVGLAGLAKLWMPNLTAKLFGDKMKTEENIGGIASKELCEALSKATGYVIGMPTVDELKDVSKEAWESCIVIRVSDNEQLTSSNKHY